MGLRTFPIVGELLWYYCSPDCGLLTWWIWDLILLWLHPLLPSPCSFFVFGLGCLFFGGLQCPPVDGCSTICCNFGILTGGDEPMSFYSAILNQKPVKLLIWSLFTFCSLTSSISWVWFLLYNISQKRYSLNWSLPPNVISDYFWQLSLVYLDLVVTTLWR